MMDTTQNNNTKETETGLSEALLSAWLRVSTSVNNSRIVSKLSYNESLVCNLLYRNHRDETAAPMTATLLCQKTKMLKSQMNRTLNQLETRGIIRRERSLEDKRVVHILLNSDALKDYEKQHESIIDILNKIITELGLEETKETISILEKICDIADHLFQNEEAVE
ncbi:MAG: MarR family transcriptional regulator [Roseburia sp.]|nr:MarR family transcriptional regulator [Roseburia sp.]